MQATLPRPLLTREQTAEILGVRIQTLGKWACEKSQPLPVVHIGRSVRYRPEDVEKYIESRTTTH